MEDKTLALLTVAFILFVCGGLAVAYAVSSSHAIRTYDSGSNGSTISVSPGGVFNVTLAENLSDGYAWAITASPGLTVADLGYTPSRDGMAGGIHAWQVTATGTGDQQFIGICQRPSGPAPDDEATFTLKVHIA